MNENPLISIISINLNDREGLKRTFNSVFNQSWQEFEFVVVDGNSTDGSRELIETRGDKIDRWISEPDKGVYHAMNKGIRMASGKYLLFLNSGDSLNNNEVLKKAAQHLENDFDIYYGDVQLYDNKHSENKSIIHYPENLTFSFFCNSTLVHQAVFIKRALFDKVFYYDEDLKFVSDWEFLICSICKYNASYNKLDFIVANYDINGISSNPINKKLLYQEREDVLNERFPLIMCDYKELIDSRNKLNLPVVKSVLELEDYITARKIHRLILGFLIKASKIKNKVLRR